MTRTYSACIMKRTARTDFACVETTEVEFGELISLLNVFACECLVLYSSMNRKLFIHKQTGAFDFTLESDLNEIEMGLFMIRDKTEFISIFSP